MASVDTKINKVVFAGKTLIDLTSDTVTSDKLLSGAIAHNKHGEQITGTYVPPVPTGTTTITNNGTFDVTEFATAQVNVPIPNGYVKPTGIKTITTTDIVDVKNYADAMVSDSNLVSENIKEGVSILGILGTHTGGIEGIVDDQGVLDISTQEFSEVRIHGSKSLYLAHDFEGESMKDIFVQCDDGNYDWALDVYHNEDGTYSFDTPNLAPENIKKDISILGVTGTYESSGINGIRYDGGPYGNKDVIIDGNTLDSTGIVIDSYNKRISISNNPQDDEQVQVDVRGYVNIKVNDTHTLNVITADNLSPENIKEGVNILGTTGTYTGSGSGGGNTLKTLLDNTKSCYYLFYNYTGNNLNDLISYGDTENVTNFSYMYSKCTSATSFPQLDTSSGTNFSYMYQNCSSATSFPQLNTSKVTTFTYMYYGCKNATSFPQLDTSSGTNFSYMFYDCSKVKKIDISRFHCNNAAGSSSCFYGCCSLKAVVIRSFGTRYALNTTTFINCYHILGTTNSTYNPNGDKDGYIYVPKDMIATLSSDTNWSAFASQFRALEDYTKDGTTTGEFDDEKAGI